MAQRLDRTLTGGHQGLTGFVLEPTVAHQSDQSGHIDGVGPIATESRLNRVNRVANHRQIRVIEQLKHD